MAYFLLVSLSCCKSTEFVHHETTTGGRMKERVSLLKDSPRFEYVLARNGSVVLNYEGAYEWKSDTLILASTQPEGPPKDTLLLRSKPSTEHQYYKRKGLRAVYLISGRPARF